MRRSIYARRQIKKYGNIKKFTIKFSRRSDCILKSNKDVKKLVKIEEHNKGDNLPKRGVEKDYVLKEAEMLVSDYLAKIETHNKQLKNRNISNRKYNRLKKYSYLASLIIFLETIMLMVI